MNTGSPFTDPLAVEAWDARFRWREDGHLRDLTVEATWQRVAMAIAAAEGPEASAWTRRFADAFADWRLLPGESILQSAGTGAGLCANRAPSAVLNAAAFVQAPLTARAQFDADRFAATASLAVRMLDDVLLRRSVARTAGVRIGLMGYADTLHLLGLRYDSDPARELAIAMARALADGCLTASIALAAERGAADVDSAALLRRCLRRDARPGMIGDLRRFGVRHGDLTAIDPHPWLALFANNVADALDPLAGPDHPYLVEMPDGARILHSSGAAITLSRRRRDAGPARPVDTVAGVPIAAQLRVRAALQPWIDAPIDYPIAVTGAALSPGAETQAERLAHELGLPSPSWRALDAGYTSIPYDDDSGGDPAVAIARLPVKA